MKFSLPPLLAAASLALAAVGALAYGLGAPEATLLGPALSRLPAAPGGPKRAALTFDDGPSAPYTAQVLDLLRARGVRATFFVCGEAAARHPELVRRIVAEGHALGNHTWSHPRLDLTSRAEIAGQIDRTQDAIEAATGVRPTLFRPPFGVRWFPLWSVLRERGMTMVLWSARGHDGALDAEGVAQAVLTRLEPGAIVLLHDGDESRADAATDRSATVRALPAIIDGARAAGYEFVAL